HLLFMGRHPYIGVLSEAADVPTPQLIRDFRFAFSRQAAQLGIRPPPRVPPLDLVGPIVGELFERAFLRGSDRAGARPTAAQWQGALGQLLGGLATCQRDAGHKFPGHLKVCPWCEIADAGGPNYFEGVAAS